jgi:tRNA(Ile)-lysidine synthase
MMVDLFKKKIIEAGMAKKGERLLLGISGGPDSIALLHLFLGIRQELKLDLVACHFNHCLRDEADSEEQFVKNICKAAGIRFISEKKEVKKFFDGDSLEQTARNLRYDFFLKCSRETKIKKLALAHHEDDLAETVLMRIVRGAGLRGLRGFLPISRYKNITIIRPLIDTRKSVILQWLEEKELKYCVDQSNFSEEFLRNRLRLKLIPLLEELNPSIVDNLAALAQTVAIDYEFIEKAAHDLLQKIVRRHTHNCVEVDLKALDALDECMFNNVLRSAITMLKGDTRGLEARHLVEVKALVKERKRESIVDLPMAIVTKTDTRLTIEARR